MEAVKVDDNDELDNLRRQNSELKGLLLRSLKEQIRLNDMKLEDFPKDLQDDPEFFLEVCSWYDLPKRWKDDAAVACSALNTQCIYKLCGQFINSISSNDRPLRWKDLPYHLKVDKEVLLHAIRTHHGPCWEDFPFQFQTDTDCLYTALCYERIKFKDVPSDLQRNHQEIALFGVQHKLIQADECPCLDREFLKRTLLEGELKWKRLPVALKTDVNFAKSICFANKELPDQILSHVVELRHDPWFWRKLLHSPELGKDFTRIKFKHLFKKYGSIEFCSDHDFMIDICRECPSVFTLVERSLASDRNFLELVLEQNAAVLQFLSHETQQLHGDLVIKAIPNLSWDEEEMTVFCIAIALCPFFWEDCDFAMTWMKAGHNFPGHVLSYEMRLAWMSNRGICLARAIHGKSLDECGLKFKENISFMLEVLEYHPELYSEARGEAKADHVVMTTAFACLPVAVDRMTELLLKGLDHEIKNYLLFLRRQLVPFETFSVCILGNILSTQSVEDTGTYLTLLNQGIETSNTYKKSLAEYLGLPSGTWLCRLQQAERNVLEAIKPWTPDASNCRNCVDEDMVGQA
eukprot:scaffold81045_cov41-Attheya_sp.AAC.1